jgi:hypothetical protein
MRRSALARIFVLAAGLTPWPAAGWYTPPHQTITKAALDSLPAGVTRRFGAELAPLINIYSIYPDLFEEMEHYGFARRGPGPRSVSEIRDYCMRPSGELVHGPTGERENDLAALMFLFERISGALAAGQQAEGAKYAGVLAHFIEDGFSPPHAVPAERLERMRPWMVSCHVTNLHAALEQTIPRFDLGGRPPRRLGAGARAFASAVLDGCYAGAAQNREDLASMVKAACASDQKKLSEYQSRAGAGAAALFADAIYTIAGQ